MKRMKVEAIFHIGDSDDEKVFADKLDSHMRSFFAPGRSRNQSMPHYESCVVSVERKTWDKVST
jgi:hypothetical protein